MPIPKTSIPIAVNGSPGQTQRLTATDSAQQLPSSVTQSAGKQAIAVLITCEENNIRFALGGVTPTQGASGVGHVLYAGQSVRIAHPDAVSSFKFINEANGQNAVLQVTPEF